MHNIALLRKRSSLTQYSLQVWGLSIAGETGVSHVMRALLAEFDLLQQCAGYPKLEEINRDALDSLPRVAYLPMPSMT